MARGRWAGSGSRSDRPSRASSPSTRCPAAPRPIVLPRTASASHAGVLTSRSYGAAAAARNAAQGRGLQMEVWTARLDRCPTCEAAYFARDEEMIRSADRVIAFWDGYSLGTAHELDYASLIGKPVEVVRAFGSHALLLPIGRRNNEPQPPDRYPGGDAA